MSENLLIPDARSARQQVNTLFASDVAPSGSPAAPVDASASTPPAGVAAAAFADAVAPRSAAEPAPRTFAAPRAATPEPFALPAPSPPSHRAPPDRRRVRTSSTPLPQLPAVAEPDTEGDGEDDGGGESDNPYAPPPRRRPLGPVPPPAPRSYADGARWAPAPEPTYSDVPAGHAARFAHAQAQQARLPRRMSVASLPASEPASEPAPAPQEWRVSVSEDGSRAGKPRRGRSGASADDAPRRALPARPLTVAERLEPTIEMAKMKRDKIARKGVLWV